MKIFLLSPASPSGIRAKQMTSTAAQFAVAKMYRSPEGVAIEDAFAFMSALYFRGKIAYARRFAEEGNIFIIAPGFGLVPAGWKLDPERMKTLRRTKVDVKVPGYRRPLERDARDLSDRLGQGGTAILLGSVATGKYVDVLRPIFQHRLRFPASFAGLGDMSRGAIMLRAVRSGEELEYATFDAPRHRAER
jgi:hypothetical protein